MKFALAVLFANLASVTAFAGAAYVASTGHDGWGWLIFAGLIAGSSVKVSTEEQGAK